ncbi:zinc finger protein 227-like [Liolophura sinensis]|uniref:zinc finger protein 227-like n=1 Tax=Liolophura sinensis TaxID=3198878 RepID=UPI0031582619
MKLYELTLVVNRLQEKAIRDVFAEHKWKFIIAGLRKCEMPRLSLSRHGSTTQSCDEGDDFKNDDISPSVLMNHSDCNSKGCSSVEMSDADDCEADDDNVGAIQIAPDLFKIGDRHSDGQVPKTGGQSIMKKELDEEASETIHLQQGEEGQSQLRNGEQLAQTVPLSMNSALAQEKPIMPSNKDGVTRKKRTVHCGSKDVTTMASDVVQRKEFDCGNCRESFATFRELRFHLQQHKLAIEGAPKCAQRSVTIALPQRNHKHGSKCKIQKADKASKYRKPRNESQKGHENSLNSVEEKVSPRKRGRPRKSRPGSPNITSESGVDTLKCYDCGNCSESFATFTELRLHLQLHKEAIEGVLPFRWNRTGNGRNIRAHSHRCETCDKTFPNASALRLHDRVHTGERPYLCNECGKAFKQRTAFQNHLRTHTGEMPFKCTMCDAAFRQLVELHRHQRRHTGEKPQLCTICGKRFAERGYLKSHMRLHTGEKPFSCTLCGKSFSQRTSLKCHMKSHHKSNWGNSGLQPVLNPREWTKDIQQTQTESNDREEGEILPDASSIIEGTRTNCLRKSTTNFSERNYHRDLVPPYHHHIIPMKSPGYTQFTRTKSYVNNTSALQLPHPQFI